jgi:hypothetical protein
MRDFQFQLSQKHFTRLKRFPVLEISTVIDVCISFLKFPGLVALISKDETYI